MYKTLRLLYNVFLRTVLLLLVLLQNVFLDFTDEPFEDQPLRNSGHWARRLGFQLRPWSGGSQLMVNGKPDKLRLPEQDF